MRLDSTNSRSQLTLQSKEQKTSPITHLHISYIAYIHTRWHSVRRLVDERNADDPCISSSPPLSWYTLQLENAIFSCTEARPINTNSTTPARGSHWASSWDILPGSEYYYTTSVVSFFTGMSFILSFPYCSSSYMMEKRGIWATNAACGTKKTATIRRWKFGHP